MQTETQRFNTGEARNTLSNATAFDQRDRLGRTVGAFVQTWELDAVQAEPNGCWCSKITHAGRWYAVDAQAARWFSDHEQPRRYGASQPTMYFETVAARDAFIAKRIADMRKRAAREFTSFDRNGRAVQMTVPGSEPQA